MIVCTSSAATDADETKHVLEFSALAQELHTTVVQPVGTLMTWLECLTRLMGTIAVNRA